MSDLDKLAELAVIELNFNEKTMISYSDLSWIELKRTNDSDVLLLYKGVVNLASFRDGTKGYWFVKKNFPEGKWHQPAFSLYTRAYCKEHGIEFVDKRFRYFKFKKSAMDAAYNSLMKYGLKLPTLLENQNERKIT